MAALLMFMSLVRSLSTTIEPSALPEGTFGGFVE